MDSTNYKKMNLRKLFLPLCSVALCLQSYAQDKSFLKDMLWYIDNPSVFEKGQEEGHAWHMPEKSMLLNGTWKFFWCDTPEAVSYTHLTLPTILLV